MKKLMIALCLWLVALSVQAQTEESVTAPIRSARIELTIEVEDLTEDEVVLEEEDLLADDVLMIWTTNELELSSLLVESGAIAVNDLFFAYLTHQLPDEDHKAMAEFIAAIFQRDASTEAAIGLVIKLSDTISIANRIGVPHHYLLTAGDAILQLSFDDTQPLLFSLFESKPILSDFLSFVLVIDHQLRNNAATLNLLEGSALAIALNLLENFATMSQTEQDVWLTTLFPYVVANTTDDAEDDEVFATNLLLNNDIMDVVDIIAQMSMPWLQYIVANLIPIAQDIHPTMQKLIDDRRRNIFYQDIIRLLSDFGLLELRNGFNSISDEQANYLERMIDDHMLQLVNWLDPIKEAFAELSQYDDRRMNVFWQDMDEQEFDFIEIIQLVLVQRGIAALLLTQTYEPNLEARYDLYSFAFFGFREVVLMLLEAEVELHAMMPALLQWHEHWLASKQ